MNLEYLKEKLIQENIIFEKILQDVKLLEIQGMGWVPPPLPYPAYTKGPRFGFMSELESLTLPLV